MGTTEAQHISLDFEVLTNQDALFSADSTYSILEGMNVFTLS